MNGRGLGTRLLEIRANHANSLSQIESMACIVQWDSNDSHLSHTLCLWLHGVRKKSVFLPNMVRDGSGLIPSLIPRLPGGLGLRIDSLELMCILCE